MNDFLLATANRDLEDIKPETLHRAAGGFRVMGYDSPFVPRAEQYHEVQLPLRESPVEALTPVIAPLP